MDRRTFLAALAGASLGADRPRLRQRARFEPPDGKALVFVGNYEHDTVDSYRRVIPHEPTGVKFLWDWDQGDAYFRHQCEKAGPIAPLLINFCFVRDWVDGNPRKARSIIPEILRGEWDAGINNVGRCFKASERPILAMIGNEFNLAQTYSPAEYIQCWRYVHERWNLLGASNVAYVWSVCPQITERAYQDWYPGDAYVDWLSSSFYGTGSNGHMVKDLGNPDRGLREIVGLAKRHGKPFMLGECGPYGGSRQTWQDWYEPFFQFVKWSGAKAFTFNNQPVLPESPAFGDERMEAMSPDIQRRWSAEMGKPRYLKPTSQLYDQIGFRQRVENEVADAGARPAIEGRTNLLTLIDPERDTITGTWNLSGGVLSFAGDKEWSKLLLPGNPPPEYDLTLVAERVRGTEILVIGLVVEDRQAMVLLDGWGGGVSGLEQIDGQASRDNETTHRGWRFTNGRRTKILCEVRKGGVTVSCDSRRIVHWTGDPGRLSLVDGWRSPDKDRLFLGGWKGGSFRFHDAFLQPVNG